MLMGFLDKLTAPKANIMIQLDKQFYSLREPLTGKLMISSSETFNADEVRLEIWVNERVQATERRQSGNQTVTVSAQENTVLHRGKIPIAGYGQMQQGNNLELPFTAYLPSGVPPSYRSQNVRTTWIIKAVIGVKGRPDVNSNDLEVLVTG